MGITLEAGVCLGAKPILEFGSPDQKEAYLPDLVSGQALAGFGLTEPDAGSDAGATKTRAALDCSGAEPQWVIDGAKTFITNSGTDITSLVTVTALTDEGVSVDHRAVRARRASSWSRRTARWAGTPPTPTA